MEHPLSIRTANLSDLPALTAIESVCFPPSEGASEDSLRARLTVYPDHFWVLERAGEIVAFVNGMVTDQPDLTDDLYDNAALHRETGAWQMIFGVDTRPDCQRRGYAGRLLRWVIAAARTQGRRGIVLTCKEHLVGYYASFGFQSEGRSVSTHGDAVWYQMRLRFSREKQSSQTPASAGT